MSGPGTIHDFLDVVRRSGLLTKARLDDFLAQQGAADTHGTPARLANVMVQKGLLTSYQAQQLVGGKYRGFIIGNYTVLDQLGHGGMASVYLCEHKHMRRRVAIKLLSKTMAQDPELLKRFYREARAIAALDHPNIVRAYDIDSDDRVHFLVMEYVDGSSLHRMVTHQGPLSITRSVHYMQQAAAGLQHAHQAGVVHRDIKPGNLLVNRYHVVKILDMGLARFFQEEEEILTRGVLGTADYLAPEQTLDSHGVDIRADIYSLGGTFYFVLTGQAPFGEGSVAQKILGHRLREPTPIQTFRPDVAPDLVAIVNKMMAKDPAQRYQEPADVIEALENWQ